MPTIIKNSRQDGSVSYTVRIDVGSKNNRVRKNFTWEPPPGMTAKRDIDAALKRFVIETERQLQGGIMGGEITVAEFFEQWLTNYCRPNLAPKTTQVYEYFGQRLLSALGHLALNKLRAVHLMEFYSNLAEPGIKKGTLKAVAKPGMADLLGQKQLSVAQLAAASEVAENTIRAAMKGQRIEPDKARRIAAAMGHKYSTVFAETGQEAALSAVSIGKYHRMISSMLETARQWQMIEDNPAKRCRPPKPEQQEPSYLQDEEALALLTMLEAAPLKWQTLFTLLLFSGARRGEVCALRWRDLDMDNQTVDINKSSQVITGLGLIVKAPKNSTSARVIKLPEHVFALLKEYRRWQLAERLRLGDRWPQKIHIHNAKGEALTLENDMLFTTIAGQPINPDSVTSWLADFCRKNGLPAIHPHSLRHSNASLLIASGTDIRTVSNRLGHADANTTLRIYSHMVASADAKAADALENALLPQTKAGQQ